MLILETKAHLRPAQQIRDPTTRGSYLSGAYCMLRAAPGSRETAELSRPDQINHYVGGGRAAGQSSKRT
jgi:hypothetical protein